jgi:hypothetical protein
VLQIKDLQLFAAYVLQIQDLGSVDSPELRVECWNDSRNRSDESKSKTPASQSAAGYPSLRSG